MKENQLPFGRRIMRGQNFIKLTKTLELLSKPQGTTLKELAEELKVDRRSVKYIRKTQNPTSGQGHLILKGEKRRFVPVFQRRREEGVP